MCECVCVRTCSRRYAALGVGETDRCPAQLPLSPPRSFWSLMLSTHPHPVSPRVTGLPQPCPWTRPSPPGLACLSLSAACSAPSSRAPSPQRPPKLLPLPAGSPWPLLSFRAPGPQPSSPAHFQDPHSLPFAPGFPQTRFCSLVLLPPFLGHPWTPSRGFSSAL